MSTDASKKAEPDFDVRAWAASLTTFSVALNQFTVAMTGLTSALNGLAGVLVGQSFKPASELKQPPAAKEATPPASGKPRKTLACRYCGKEIMWPKEYVQGNPPVNLDGTPHLCRDNAQTPSGDIPPAHRDTLDALMRFGVSIWPKDSKIPFSVTQDPSGEWLIVPSPSGISRDAWGKFAKQLGDEFGAEYVSDRENRAYFFKVHA